MEHITKYYPKAQSLSSFQKTLHDELKNNDLDTSNCIWGTSICSDEVNNSFHQFSNMFVGLGAFRFGGISGLPFTGKTGFKAFASHIPEDGGALILYGPHIGISREGNIGKIQRQGQSDLSTCCVSLIAGLENVKSGNVLMISNDDYQQGQVNKLLIENYEDIKKSDNQIKAVTDITYKQINREITDIISSCKDSLGNSPVLAIGGIIINTDWDQEDYFVVRDVSVYNK